jgi:squalene-associated FAD-dependent desaturase
VTDARPHVVVVGGGFAGLTAAVRTARGGARTTLVERRPFLGGRAYSFADAASGDVLDNGPHAFMGAYTALLRFLDDVGARDGLAFQPRLHVPMAHATDGEGAVAAPAWPGPLQAPGAILRYRLLSRADRVRLLVGAVALVARSPARLAGQTVAAALDGLGQRAPARARFWDPLAIATLNEDPARAAAAPFAAVLRRGFLAGARAARFGFARGPLGACYAEPARRAIERAGGTVVTGTSATTVELDGGSAVAVALRDGRRLAADAVVLALPAAALARVLPPPLAAHPTLAAAGRLATSPIVSVHLWVDGPVAVGAPEAGAPFVGMIDSRAQWLFDCGPSGAGGRRLATVTSGARFWDGADDATIAADVLADVRRVLPRLRDVGCTRAHVVRERHATLSLTPDAERARPGTATPVANLFLAGDWVRTGLPATIESAVVSGDAAARAALAAAAAPGGRRAAA